MVYNTTSAEMLDKSLDVDIYRALIRQICYAVFGITIAIIAYFLGYRKICAASPYLFGLTLIVLSLVFVPKIGQEINGARRWISILGVSFQPSEIAKFFFPLFFIYWIQKEKKVSFFPFLKILSCIATGIVLIFLQPDNGTCAIIIATLAVVFFLTKVFFRYWALPLCLFLVFALPIAYNMPHVRSRVYIYLHPEEDLRGKGHQPYQAKIAAGSGKLWGKGLGASFQKLNYLPEARSDYIAAIYAEEFGFLGMVGLIGIYSIISFLGVYIAMRAKEKEGLCIAGCITFLLSFQSFLNLGVVSGLLPSKGTTLPFLSQGGSSLIMNIFLIGILVSISNERKIYEKI